MKIKLFVSKISWLRHSMFHFISSVVAFLLESLVLLFLVALISSYLGFEELFLLVSF